MISKTILTTTLLSLVTDKWFLGIGITSSAVTQEITKTNVETELTKSTIVAQYKVHSFTTIPPDLHVECSEYAVLGGCHSDPDHMFGNCISSCLSTDDLGVIG